MHTVSVLWHQPAGEEAFPFQVRLVGQGQWVAGASKTKAWDPAKRDVHCVRLTGLSPGARYEFRFGEEEKSYTFRTVPDPTKACVKFAVGGDMRCEWRPSKFRGMAKAVAEEEPHFVVAGGDLAYCRGRANAWPRWEVWLREWQDLMVTAKGDLIPVVPVLGNHEVDGGYGQERTAAPHFFALFDFPDDSPIRALDIGTALSLLLLDSGHCHAVAGAQTEWLQTALSQRRTQAFRCAVYHVPAYACRDASSTKSAEVRKHWAPVLEKEEVEVAFEHHHHALKRTKPLKHGEPAVRGTIYLGDGSWGVPPRAIERESFRELMDFSAAENGCWIAEVMGKKMVLRAIDRKNQELDRVVVVSRPRL